MFPYYQGAEGKDFSLGYDDILAMYELYSKFNKDDNFYLNEVITFIDSSKICWRASNRWRWNFYNKYHHDHNNDHKNHYHYYNDHNDNFSN